MQKLNDWNLSTRAILLDTFGFCRLKVAYVCDVFVERSKIESRVQSRSILAQRNAGLLEIAKLVCCHPPSSRSENLRRSPPPEGHIRSYKYYHLCHDRIAKISWFI